MSGRAARVLQADLAGTAESVRNRVMVFRLVIALGGRLRALMDRRLAGAGITTQQAAVLTVASAAETPPTQGEIASRLGVSHQNVRQLIDALERKGFVAVQSDAQDRRMKRVVPTKRVHGMFGRRNSSDFEAVATWFASLDDPEIDVLLDLLARLAESVFADEREPQP